MQQPRQSSQCVVERGVGQLLCSQTTHHPGRAHLADDAQHAGDALVGAVFGLAYTGQGRAHKIDVMDGVNPQWATDLRVSRRY